MPFILSESIKFTPFAAATAAAFALAACGGGTVSSPPERSVASLRLIGQQVLPRRVEFGGTVVGGLSGIDYDEVNNRYVLISDDRTTNDSPNAPRMYFANLAFDATSFSGVTFTSTFPMRQPNGNVYPKAPDALTADPESVRFNPSSGNLLWASEGHHTGINPSDRSVRARNHTARHACAGICPSRNVQDIGHRNRAAKQSGV